MARYSKKPAPLDLGNEATGADASARYGTRVQLAELFQRRFGPPLSPKTLERWPLGWRIVNGRAVASVDEFLAEAERRFNDAPLIRGGQVVTKAA